MRHLLALAVLFAAGLAVPAAGLRAAEYLETFEPGKDPEAIMAGTLLVGSDGAWQGELSDGAYLLSNPGQAGGVRYFHIRQRQDKAPAVVTISVDVEGRFEGPLAGAGLLYDFDKASKSYFAFVLGKDGGYTVWRRDPEGFKRIAAGTHDAIRADGVNLLAARLAGGKVELTINGAKILSYSTEQASEGGVGIIALDTGAYRFDNFRYAVE